MKQGLPKKLNHLLAQRKQEGNYRSLKDLSTFTIDFASNDYLGLAQDARLKNISFCNYGSGGSRLISGNNPETTELEDHLMKYYHSQAALVFTSGYLANLSLLSSVPQEGDLVIYDSLCHASIRDGLRLSRAERIAYNHNNLEQLEEILQTAKAEEKFVISEGLFSMDGDFPDISTLLDICQQHNTYLIMDESHSAGVLGKTGRGICESHEQHPNLLARMIGFGKGIGAQGAVILGSNDLKDYLINYGRSFVFSTSASYANIQLIQHQHKVLKEMGMEKREQLQGNIDYFLRQTKGVKGFSNEYQTPIQAYLGSKEELLLKQNELEKNKIYCKAILSPTVKKGAERFRINLHSFNKASEIDLLLSILAT